MTLCTCHHSTGVPHDISSLFLALFVKSAVHPSHGVFITLTLSKKTLAFNNLEAEVCLPNLSLVAGWSGIRGRARENNEWAIKRWHGEEGIEQQLMAKLIKKCLRLESGNRSLWHQVASGIRTMLAGCRASRQCLEGHSSSSWFFFFFFSVQDSIVILGVQNMHTENVKALMHRGEIKCLHR